MPAPPSAESDARRPASRQGLRQSAAPFLATRRRLERLALWTRWGGKTLPAYPPAPAGEVLYAIGDIHGRADRLAEAQAGIDRDAPGSADSTTEIYLGDYVDRGPDSKRVVEMMIARAKGRRVVALRGNHETLMESFLAGRLPFAAWRGLGGVETMLSYGLDPALLRRSDGPQPEAFARRLPEAHRRFLRDLTSVHIVGGYCFVHAGLRPGVALAEQADEDLTGIREPFLAHRGDYGFVVVHGHTPAARVEFRPNRINIDTGAYLSNRLSVLRIGAAGAALLEAAVL